MRDHITTIVRAHSVQLIHSSFSNPFWILTTFDRSIDSDIDETENSEHVELVSV